MEGRRVKRKVKRNGTERGGRKQIKKESSK